MKKLILSGISMVLLAAPVLAANNEALTSEARGVAMQFGKTLKKELVGAMKSSGAIRAIDVCNTEAPKIASSVGKSMGWEVGRTTLRLRNPGNAPDDWELSILNEFAQRKAAGEDIKSLEATEIVEVNGRKMFRYMKAIPTAEPCIACHGAEINPQVEARIGELYPEDTARGFKAGDLRGAFTLSKPL